MDFGSPSPDPYYLDLPMTRRTVKNRSTPAYPIVLNSAECAPMVSSAFDDRRQAGPAKGFLSGKT
jgi:hypothetical protein